MWKETTTAVRRLIKAQGVTGFAGQLLGIRMRPRPTHLRSWPEVQARVERGRAVEPAFFPSIGEYPVYDELAYALMTSDQVRVQAFQNALDRMAPGRRVLDIGTGKDVNWARYAADRGASSVVAVEGQASALPLARKTLESYPRRDRITLLDGWSTSLTLDDLADVCVSEIIGTIAGSEGAATILEDARRRLTRAGATMIPARAVTMAAAVCIRDIAPGFQLSPFAPPYLEQLFRLRGAPFDVRMCLSGATPDHPVSSAGIVEDLDFRAGAQAEGKEAVTLVVTRPGRADGLMLWLRLWAHPDDEPIDSLAQRTSWWPVYLPIFEEPVTVTPGDAVEVDFVRSLSADGIHPDYAASMVVKTTGGTYEGAADLPYQPAGFRDNWFHRRLFTT